MMFLGEDPRLRVIHETLKAARAPRPRLAILSLADPMTTIGPWVTEVIRRAGGIDVLASDATDAEARSVCVEALRTADPALIVFACIGATLDPAVADVSRELAAPAWSWARDRHVLAIDAALLAAPGPSLIEAVEALAPSLAPSLFPPAPARYIRPIPFPAH